MEGVRTGSRNDSGTQVRQVGLSDFLTSSAVRGKVLCFVRWRKSITERLSVPVYDDVALIAGAGSVIFPFH